ncbi:MAG: glutamate-5-semialdehyde dehydrogenase [Oscillospiraceae bacterium]|nr:glutamate-5-semialdehyde dehydrogenase [Oscillospiraceae bacterium]
MSDLQLLGKKAKAAAVETALYSAEKKKNILLATAKILRQQTDKILKANKEDLDRAVQNQMAPSLQDRLKLDEKRIESMAVALEEIAQDTDPLGQEMERIIRPNGLLIRKVRVPIGVIGVIYEARPNVTSDVAGLCLKAGNAVVLRGGKEAFSSNQAITELLRQALREEDANEDSVQLVTDLSRESAVGMMQMTDYLDLLIPRGGAGLIRTVVRESRVPVIQTGEGNCHLYVDRAADLSMAVSILENAKVSRPSVCNACESLLVHKEIAETFLPKAAEMLAKNGVQVFACERALPFLPQAELATESDFAAEYLDLKLSVKVVDSLEEAVSHIRRYGTHHSEAIITSDPLSAAKFQKEVDAAAVYWNASTRFTDGGEFGFGGEIGISTQKLHARGPIYYIKDENRKPSSYAEFYLYVD